MRLSTRLTILLIAITTTVAALVGWYAVAASSRADYSSLDGTLNAIVASGQGHPLTALSSALSVVQQNNYDVTLDVVSPDGTVTQIASGRVALTKPPSLSDIHRSLSVTRSSSDLPGFRYRSLSVGGGDFLVVAGSTSRIARRTHHLVVGTLIVGVLAAALMGVVARLFMRRDLGAMTALVSFSSAVAAGDVQRPSPVPDGSSDIRQLREALIHMVRSLQRTIETEQRVAQLTQQFIGDASHELRTPLTVVRGYAELLSNPSITLEQRDRALERIQREVGRMDLLVNDLLFLAEVHEAPTREEESVDLSALVSARVGDFAADHPDHPLTLDVDPGLRVLGRLDFAERLVRNALANIARHTGATDEVRVSLRRDGRRAVLGFEDGGPGLPADSYGQRPERFQRFDSARARASGGSGLGMSIMADVATALGGTMTTAPSPLAGLALTFSFPVGEESPT